MKILFSHNPRIILTMAQSHISWLLKLVCLEGVAGNLMSALGPVADTVTGALDWVSEDLASGLTLPFARGGDGDIITEILGLSGVRRSSLL